MECLAYGFEVGSKQKLATKAAVIAAFTTQNFKLINGTVVSEDLLTSWIPDNVGIPKETEPAFQLQQPVNGINSTTIKQ